MVEATNWDSPYWSRVVYTFRDAVLEKYKDEIIVHDHVTYQEYCKQLPTFEWTAVIQGNGCYPSQRAFEALAAGCEVKVYHENKTSHDVFQSLGPLTRDNVLKNHTYKNRVEQILKQVEDDL